MSFQTAKRELLPLQEIRQQGDEEAAVRVRPVQGRGGVRGRGLWRGLSQQADLH